MKARTPGCANTQMLDLLSYVTHHWEVFSCGLHISGCVAVDLPTEQVILRSPLHELHVFWNIIRNRPSVSPYDLSKIMHCSLKIVWFELHLRICLHICSCTFCGICLKASRKTEVLSSGRSDTMVPRVNTTNPCSPSNNQDSKSCNTHTHRCQGQ